MPMATDASSNAALFELPELSLTEIDGSQRKVYLRPDSPILTVGRSRQNTIFVRDGLVSALHLRFEWRDSGVCVQDVGSRHGTCVNGAAIPQNQDHVLHDSDEVQIGRTVICYKCYAERIDGICRGDQAPPASVRSAPILCEQSETDTTADIDVRQDTDPGVPTTGTVLTLAPQEPDAGDARRVRRLWQGGLLLLFCGSVTTLWFLVDIAGIARGWWHR